MQHPAEFWIVAQCLAYFLYSFSCVDNDRKVEVYGKFQLSLEQFSLSLFIRVVDVVVETTFPHCNRLLTLQPMGKLQQVGIPVFRHEHRVQAVGGMEPGVLGTYRFYPRPPSLFDRRNDLSIDPFFPGASNHFAPVRVEALVVDMAMGIDEFHVNWESVSLSFILQALIKRIDENRILQY